MVHDLGRYWHAAVSLLKTHSPLGTQSAAVWHITVHAPSAQMRPEAQSLFTRHASAAARPEATLALLHAGAASAKSAIPAKSRETIRSRSLRADAGATSRFMAILREWARDRSVVLASARKPLAARRGSLTNHEYCRRARPLS
jgi:hypothetical protein